MVFNMMADYEQLPIISIRKRLKILFFKILLFSINFVYLLIFFNSI
jgi:hypothetical protein